MATSTVVPLVRTLTRVLLAVMLMALGIWVFLVPLAGPYFSFGFDTATRWRFSQVHWITSLAPGMALFGGGVLLLSRRRPVEELGAFAALAAGVWLEVAPSLHGVWSSTAFIPQPAGAWHTAWLWIGYFYGPGALAIYLSARAQALRHRSQASGRPTMQQSRSNASSRPREDVPTPVY